MKANSWKSLLLLLKPGSQAMSGVTLNCTLRLTCCNGTLTWSQPLIFSMPNLIDMGRVTSHNPSNRSKQGTVCRRTIVISQAFETANKTRHSILQLGARSAKTPAAVAHIMMPGAKLACKAENSRL